MQAALHLERLDTYVIALPARRPHLWVGIDSPAGSGYVVTRVTLSNGVVGWGEAQVIKTWGGDNQRRYGETPATTVMLIRETLVPALKGVDVRQFEQVHAAMNRSLRGYPYAKAAVEVALFDAVGKSLGVPVHQLLGGKVRDKIELAHSIGLMEIDVAVDEARRVVAEGIKTLKVKIGVGLERDVAMVSAIRKAIGDAPRIRVDANQGYKSWREALQAVKRMEACNIVYAEQMVEGLAGLAEISQRCEVPLMADESAWTDRDVIEIAKQRAAQFLSVYYTKPGGLLPAKRLLAVAGALQMQCDINGSGEMGVGNAANLHLAASSPEICLPGTIPVTSTAEIVRTQVAGHKYLDDIIVTPFEYEDGFLKVPDGPGLGIEVDEDKLRRYSIALN